MSDVATKHPPAFLPAPGMLYYSPNPAQGYLRGLVYVETSYGHIEVQQGHAHGIR